MFCTPHLCLAALSISLSLTLLRILLSSISVAFVVVIVIVVHYKCLSGNYEFLPFSSSIAMKCVLNVDCLSSLLLVPFLHNIFMIEYAFDCVLEMAHTSADHCVEKK